MRLKSVETTPNPNSMKLNFHESFGKAVTYTAHNADNGSDFVRSLLQIEGVMSVFVCHDFITINRTPGADWHAILSATGRLVESEGAQLADFAPPAANSVSSDMSAASADANTGHSGQVSVVVQTFKGIPVQVKVLAPGCEKRVALSQRFSLTAQTILEKTGADFLKERYWADHGVRYGEPEEIAAQVADEIEGTIDDRALQHLCDLATGAAQGFEQSMSAREKEDGLNHSDWHVRLKVVQELGRQEEDIVLLERALADEQMQVRRFAAAGLGATGSSRAVPALCRALLNDETVAVRRTAGDALSDIGDAGAEPSICKALSDENKLVRWRACRFLSEVGTSESLPFLEPVMNDEEYEVRLEAQAAIERIAGGNKGLAPVWKRMHDKDA